MRGYHRGITVFLFGMIASFCFGCLYAVSPCVAYDREGPVVKAVRAVSPAVVNISSVISARKRSGPFSSFGLNPFFDSFFKDFFDPYLERQPERSTLGSGVILDGKRGLIITNAHVIANAGTIKVTLRDEREFEAEIVGADPDFDLAVLRIQSKALLPEVKMGSSDDLMIGETVIAIGNPFGLSHTLTVGVVSAKGRTSVGINDYEDFIQTDAAINLGNSGGALVNAEGELVGINTAFFSRRLDSEGIGFAIPVDLVRGVVEQIKLNGRVIRGYMGLLPDDLTDADARIAAIRDLVEALPAT